MKTKILSVFLAAVMLFSVVMLAGCGKKGFDYKGEDLLKYISYTVADYGKLPVEIETDITDRSVIDAIVSKLEALSDTDKALVFAADRAVAENDVVALYYRGVTYDSEGAETEFTGGTYLGEEKPYLLWVGSDTFIPGFEDALVGMVPNETSVTERTDGTVASDDIVVLDIAGLYDGEASYIKYENLTTKLSETTAFEKAIADKLVGEKVGEKIIFDLDLEVTVSGKKETKTVTFAATVKKVLEVNAKKISVKFPDDYDQSLAGKDAYFYIVIENLATLDSATLEKLGHSGEGEDVLSAYKASVKEALIKEYAENQEKEEDFADLVKVYLWSALLENIVVNEYPKGTIDSYIKTEKNNLEFEYYASADASSYQAKYDTLEDYAKAKYGETNYDAVIEENAKAFVKGKLALYAMAKAEGVINVSKAEKNATLEEMRAQYEEYYNQMYSLYNSIFGYGYSESELKALAKNAAESTVQSMSETYVAEATIKNKLLEKLYAEYDTSFDGGLISWVSADQAEEEQE